MLRKFLPREFQRDNSEPLKLLPLSSSQYQKGEPYAVVFPPQAATLLQRITHDVDPIQTETRGQRLGSKEVWQQPLNAGSLLTESILERRAAAPALVVASHNAPPPASAPLPRAGTRGAAAPAGARPRTAKSKKRPHVAPPRAPRSQRGAAAPAAPPRTAKTASSAQRRAPLAETKI